MRLYIAVHEDVPDHMVPVLVAHTMLGAHNHFNEGYRAGDVPHDHMVSSIAHQHYRVWYADSFKKCVVKVNQKEFDKIRILDDTYLGYENTTMGGQKSCAIPYPRSNDDLPNVLKFAKLWKPNEYR